MTYGRSADARSVFFRRSTAARVALLAAFMGAAFLIASGAGDAGTAGAAPSRPNSVRATIERTIKVVPDAGNIVSAGGRIWIVGNDHTNSVNSSGFLASVDPASGVVTKERIHEARPTFILHVDGKLWIADDYLGGNDLRAFDIENGRQAGKTIRFPGSVEIQGVAYGDGLLWVTTLSQRGHGSLWRVDPTSHAIVGVTRLGIDDNLLGSVAFADRRLWIAVGTKANDSAVIELDPLSTHAIGKPIRVGKYPLSMLYVDSRLWVTNWLGNSVSEIDPTTRKVVTTLVVGKGPQSTAAADGRLWVLNLGGNTISEVDPETAKIVGTPLRVTGGPESATFTAGSLWVTDFYSGTLTQIKLTTG